MEKNECPHTCACNLPAGWRIAYDTYWNGGQVDTLYVVQSWQTWTVRPHWWSRKRVNRTGWRTKFSSPFEWEAEQWAHDTIRALQETNKGTH